MRNGARLDWEEARRRIARIRESLERGGERPSAERERILRDRAVRLARPDESAAPEYFAEHLIVVTVGSERFAIPLAAVTEVVRDARCAPVPHAPPALAGMIQIRGEIRPVFHIALASPAGGTAGRIVLIARGGGGREAGLLADRVEDVRTHAPADRRPAPAGVPRVQWMTPDMIPVLDPDRLFPEEFA